MFRPQGRELNILEDKFERNYSQNKNFHNILTSIKFGDHKLIFFNFYFVIWCHGINRSFYSEIPLKQRSRKISKYHNSMFIMLRVKIEPAVFFTWSLEFHREIRTENWEMQDRAIESEKPIWLGNRMAKKNNFLILVCLFFSPIFARVQFYDHDFRHLISKKDANFNTAVFCTYRCCTVGERQVSENDYMQNLSRSRNDLFRR